MKHKCENFIENNRCTKCRTPEWAYYFPEFEHKIGSRVKIPDGYRDGGKIYRVLYKIKNGYYAIGLNKRNPIEGYAWWEIYPIKRGSLK